MQTMDLHLTQPGDGWKMEFFARKQLKLKIAKKIATNFKQWICIGTRPGDMDDRYSVHAIDKIGFDHENCNHDSFITSYCVCVSSPI